MTESSWPPGEGLTCFDSQVGLAIRWRCAPVLGLQKGADADAYLARRAELGWREASRLLVRDARVEALLIETGYRSDDILGVDEMGTLASARASEVVRLEALAEKVFLADTGTDFAGRFMAALEEAATSAVALKSIAAYRYGLDFDPGRPSSRDVESAVVSWAERAERSGRTRLDDPVLLRFLIWCGVDTGLPIQFHVGYGDNDVDLHRCNPLLMTRWLRATCDSGTRVALLHCYPFHREAGYLAQVFPHVYCDVGLAVNYTGARSAAVIAESLELAPFHKLLYSSDAFGLAELHQLGSSLFRSGLARTLAGWVDRGDADQADALRIARLIGWENAVRLYGIGSPG